MIQIIGLLARFAFMVSLVGPIDPRYHTYDEVWAELDSLALTYPSISALDTLCLSTRDSLAIPVIKISDNPTSDDDEPALLYNGQHHGEELLGGEVALYLINDLLARYASDTLIHRWIDETEIFIVPMLNPEGKGIVMSGLDSIWRKNKRDNNNNGSFDLDSDGVDLNRNYDFCWDSGGTSDPSSENYRGPSPFSENETRGIRDLARQNHFVFDICYHNVRTGEGELAYYPWRWGVGFCKDYPFIKKIVDTLAAKIINDAGTNTYVPIYGYANEGTARNWLYGVCGTYAYTIEVSRTCYPPGNKVDSICMRNMPGAYYLMERVLGSGITGLITDSVTGQPLAAEFRIESYYDSTLPPRLSDSTFGRYRKLVNAGTYTVHFIESGYVSMTFGNVVVQPGIPTVLNVKMRPLAIAESDDHQVDNGRLEAYPNPFTRKLTIKFQIPNPPLSPFTKGGQKGEFPCLKIYDATGRLVKQFSRLSAKQFGGIQPFNQIIWSGSDDTGRPVPAGVYFIKLEIDRQKLMDKVLLLR
ncbi:MAG TPA: M14 family zinc carboxypeptidase [bacterium]